MSDRDLMQKVGSQPVSILGLYLVSVCTPIQAERTSPAHGGFAHIMCVCVSVCVGVMVVIRGLVKGSPNYNRECNKQAAVGPAQGH